MHKHILFVLDYFLPHKGGAETVFENIIKRLVDRGYHVSVLTSRFDPTLKKHEAINILGSKHRVDIYRAGASRRAFLWYSFWFGRKLLHKYKDISLIHTSTYGGAIPAVLLARLLKKKVIITVHEVFGKLRYLYKGRLKGWLYLMMERAIFCFRYDTYHCVSRYTMNSLRLMYGIPDTKLVTIYNGIDTDFWDPTQVSSEDIYLLRKKYKWEQDKVLLYYGHSGMSKGLDFLIKAIPQLMQEDNLHLVFNIIHAERDAECRSMIAEQIQKLPSEKQKKIRIFDGFPMEELRELVASVDMVVAPSLSEGFGSVHTESTSMGKILITTHIGPLPEVLGGKVIFIEPQSEDAICVAVHNALNGEVTRIAPKFFSWEKCVTKLEKIYNSI